MRSIRRVLISHPYGIGDLLFATPVLRALRLLPTVEKVDLLLGSRTDVVMRTNPHVDEIFVVDKDRAHHQSSWQNFQDALNLGKELKKRKYDLLIDYSMRREYAFFSKFFLGIPRRAGFDYKGRGFFHNIRFPLEEGFLNRHVTDYYCDLVEQAGIAVRHRHMEFYLTKTNRQIAEQFIHDRGIGSSERLLVLSPGGGESWGEDAHLKRWPAATLAEFANQIILKLKIDRVIILGSSKETKLAEKLMGQFTIPCVNFAGQVDLMTSAAFIERALLFVGNDGGLVHIARALRRPLIAIYGPADPQVYGPYPYSDEAISIYQPEKSDKPCYQKFRYSKECKCLERLSAAQAMAVLEKENFLTKNVIFNLKEHEKK